MPPKTRSSSTRTRKPYDRKAKCQPEKTTHASPSVLQLQKLKKLENFKLSNESGDSDTFKPGDWWAAAGYYDYLLFIYREPYVMMGSVFIAHPGVNKDRGTTDGHQYWKGQIISIHSWSQKTWLVLRWFYTVTQLKKEGLKCAVHIHSAVGSTSNLIFVSQSTRIKLLR